MSDIETNKKVAAQFFEALGKLDVEGLMKLIDPNIVFNVQNSGCMGGKLGLQDLATVGAVLGATCPEGIRFEIRDVTAEDDRVSVRVDGFAKTDDGGEYNNRYHFLMKFKQGKICETFEYLDSLLVEKVFAERYKKFLESQAG